VGLTRALVPGTQRPDSVNLVKKLPIPLWEKHANGKSSKSSNGNSTWVWGCIVQRPCPVQQHGTLPANPQPPHTNACPSACPGVCSTAMAPHKTASSYILRTVVDLNRVLGSVVHSVAAIGHVVHPRILLLARALHLSPDSAWRPAAPQVQASQGPGEGKRMPHGCSMQRAKRPAWRYSRPGAPKPPQAARNACPSYDNTQRSNPD